MFSTLLKKSFNFSFKFMLLSANAFNLEQSKILLFGKELTCYMDPLSISKSWWNSENDEVFFFFPKRKKALPYWIQDQAAHSEQNLVRYLIYSVQNWIRFFCKRTCWNLIGVCLPDWKVFSCRIPSSVGQMLCPTKIAQSVSCRTWGMGTLVRAVAWPISFRGLSIVIATAFIPIPVLTIVLTTVMWESSN